MLRKITFATLVSILLGGCAGSTSVSQNSTSLLPVRGDLQHYQLENGLQVYLLQRNQPGVELRLLVSPWRR